MVYEIDSRPRGINWAAQGNERIVQNARNLLCMRLGEVALNRWRGIDAALSDVALAQAQDIAQSEIRRVLAWEPRARVLECGARIAEDSPGAFLLWARIEVGEE